MGQFTEKDGCMVLGYLLTPAIGYGIKGYYHGKGMDIDSKSLDYLLTYGTAAAYLGGSAVLTFAGIDKTAFKTKKKFVKERAPTMVITGAIGIVSGLLGYGIGYVMGKTH